MRKIYCLLLAALITNIALCQREQERIPTILKLNVPSFGDEITFPTIRLSAERKISEKISLGIETGYQLYTIENSIDTMLTKPRGIKLGAELRYYPKHKKISDLTGFYMAANIFYRYNKYTEQLYYYPKEENFYRWDEMLSDKYVVKKIITGLHFIVGNQINFKVPIHKEKRKKVFPKIFLDGSVGTGLFYRLSKNTDREFDKVIHDRYTSRHPNFFDAQTKSGLSENSGIRPSFVFNFRVGYRL